MAFIPPGYRQAGKARIYVDRTALRAYVRDLPEVRAAVQRTADAIAATARAHAPVGHDTRNGHRPGTLRDSITTERPMRAGQPGQTVRVVTRLYYAKFVEFGTRNMRPRPFMRPAANAYRQSGPQGG
jgi:HK97 gp10 family phage protein